ncbi:MAG: fibrobacter succinogenes major paralogous domain-containing protein [Fibrobacter sp.]|jgi:uncharacterized protein (TIGR02145 family)|nr:fibrobacter succinogenes major paralogous domain-containing protein [Fibrobacter sp.]
MALFSKKIIMLFGAAVFAFSLTACGGDSSTGGDDIELSSSSIEADDPSSSSEIKLSSSSHTDVSDPLSSSLQEISSSSTESVSSSSSVAESSSSAAQESSSSGEEVSSSSTAEESSSSGLESSSSIEQSSSSKEPESSSSSEDNMCGTVPYDPRAEFCFKDNIYDRCGGDRYTPNTKFCFKNRVYDKCNGMEYDPSKQICTDDVVLSKCGDLIGYDPEKEFCDIRDYQTYKWVKIATQTWMAENLNYTKSPINSWCYDEDDANCDIYGPLYDWETAMAACPEGWHLPSREEWNTLVSFAGGLEAADRLKSADGWDGAGRFGFNALPGGSRSYLSGNFSNAGNNGYWWTATENNSDNAYRMDMRSGNNEVTGMSNSKDYGYSVRCVKD